MEIQKEYTNGEVNVIWKPKRCIHSAKCVGGLPEAFKPNEKPWIQLEGIDSKKLMEVVDRCPSGALTYTTDREKPMQESATASGTTKVEVLDNGPLMVHGPLEVTYADGKTEMKKRNAAFCRCGKTGNTPFCDGSHNR